MDGAPRPRRRPYKELSLAQLRSFEEVCRRGGYAAAARELRLTSPAVWEQIQALQRHFGVVLMERRGSRVIPTPQGRRLLELVGPQLAGLETAKDTLRQGEGAFPERLSLVTNLRVLVDEVSRAMCEFRRLRPGIRLLVRYVGIDEVPPLTAEGQADVTLTLEPGPDDELPAAVQYEPAGELDYLLVTPTGHELIRRKVLRLESIIEHPLVLGEPLAYSRHRVQEVLHRYALTGKMQIGVETSSDEYTLACVRAGLGVGIAVGNSTSPLYQGLGVRSLRRWFGTARVGFLWRRGAHVPPLQRQLAELLRLNLGGHPRQRHAARRS